MLGWEGAAGLKLENEERDLKESRGDGTSWKSRTQGGCYRKRVWAQAEVEPEVGPRQALPIPGVLKPVTVSIPQPHKLVKDYGAEEGSGVSMALQEPPGEQL